LRNDRFAPQIQTPGHRGALPRSRRSFISKPPRVLGGIENVRFRCKDGLSIRSFSLNRPAGKGPIAVGREQISCPAAALRSAQHWLRYRQAMRGGTRRRGCWRNGPGDGEEGGRGREAAVQDGGGLLAPAEGPERRLAAEPGGPELRQPFSATPRPSSNGLPSG